MLKALQSPHITQHFPSGFSLNNKVTLTEITSDDVYTVRPKELIF